MHSSCSLLVHSENGKHSFCIQYIHTRGGLGPDVDGSWIGLSGTVCSETCAMMMLYESMFTYNAMTIRDEEFTPCFQLSWYAAWRPRIDSFFALSGRGSWFWKWSVVRSPVICSYCLPKADTLALLVKLTEKCHVPYFGRMDVSIYLYMSGDMDNTQIPLLWDWMGMRLWTNYGM